MGKVITLAKGENVLVKTDGKIWIPVFVVVVFVISYVLSKLYIWIWGIINKEKALTNLLLRIARDMRMDRNRNRTMLFLS